LVRKGRKKAKAGGRVSANPKDERREQGSPKLLSRGPTPHRGFGTVENLTTRKKPTSASDTGNTTAKGVRHGGITHKKRKKKAGM